MTVKVLELDKQWFAALERGEKSTTIRRYRDDLSVGDTLIFLACKGWRRFVVNVTRVEVTSLLQLGDEDARLDGSDNADQLRGVLRGYYAAYRGK